MPGIIDRKYIDPVFAVEQSGVRLELELENPYISPLADTTYTVLSQPETRYGGYLWMDGGRL